MSLAWSQIEKIMSEKLQRDDLSDLELIIHNINVLSTSYALNASQKDNIHACTQKLTELLETKDPLLTDSVKIELYTLQQIIHDIVSDKVSPLMYQQNWYMDRMKALGYKIIGKGECYGFSHMAIQAFLSDDMDVFNQRLQTIYSIPMENFYNDFKQLREKRQQFLDNGKPEEAETISKTMIDLYAFFDGVALTQRPEIYLLDEEHQPVAKKQNVLKTRPLTLSTQLEAKNSEGKQPNMPALIATFAGNYDNSGLINYFDLLKNQLGEHSFALNLLSRQHAITLAYDANSQRWLLIDPNYLPPEEYLDSETLAADLLKRFIRLSGEEPSSSSSLIMGTQITVLSKYEQNMKEKFDALARRPEWALLHRATPDYQRDAMDYSISRMMEHYQMGDDKKVSDVKIIEMAQQTGQHDVIIDLLRTKGVSLLQKIPNNKEQVLKILPLELGLSLFNQLSTEEKTQILKRHFDWRFADSLPKEEWINIFLRLPLQNQINYLIGIEAHQPDAFTLERKTLLDKLSFEKKIRLIDSGLGGDDVFFFLPESEQTALFKELNPRVQAACLKSSPKPDELIKLLSSIEEKTRVVSCSSMCQLLRALPTQEQLPIFLRLSASKQYQFLCGFPKNEPVELDVWLGKLITDQKMNIQLEGVPIEEQSIGFQLLFSKEERAGIFHQLPKNVQGCILLSYSDDAISERNALLEDLSFDEKISLMSECGKDGNVAVFLMCDHDERLDIFLTLPRSTQNQLLRRFQEENSDEFIRIANTLSAKELASIVQDGSNSFHGYCFEIIPSNLMISVSSELDTKVQEQYLEWLKSKHPEGCEVVVERIRVAVQTDYKTRLKETIEENRGLKKTEEPAPPCPTGH